MNPISCSMCTAPPWVFGPHLASLRGDSLRGGCPTIPPGFPSSTLQNRVRMSLVWGVEDGNECCVWYVVWRMDDHVAWLEMRLFFGTLREYLRWFSSTKSFVVSSKEHSSIPTYSPVHARLRRADSVRKLQQVFLRGVVQEAHQRLRSGADSGKLLEIRKESKGSQSTGRVVYFLQCCGRNCMIGLIRADAILIGREGSCRRRPRRHNVISSWHSD